MRIKAAALLKHMTLSSERKEYLINRKSYYVKKIINNFSKGLYFFYAIN